ncbi:MAG: hypothetical protein JO086_06735, partial [Acidimicrobiia bacterium]|nr:hypothetical protein [Acidimicrobiia bacterium]
MARRIALLCAVMTVLAVAVWAVTQRTEVRTTAAVAPTTTAPDTTTNAVPPTPGTTASTVHQSVAPEPQPPAPAPPGLGIGARGPEVLALEQRLVTLHYDPGAVDG